MRLSGGFAARRDTTVFDLAATQTHYRGYWNDLWFRLAARSHIQRARDELARLMAGYGQEPSEYYFEELAKEAAYEESPCLNDEILLFAELCPQIWDKADELDHTWGPGTEYAALRWAIGALIFEELLDMVPGEG